MFSAAPYPIPAFNDNYIWAIVHQKCHTCWVVDPGNAPSVINFLSKHRLKLAGILLTHHHHDHQGGVSSLCKQKDIPIWVPKNGQCQGNCPVDEGDTISLDQELPDFRVIRVPGHTLDHIAYVSDQWLFCGDTLFSGGCGRVFEGTHHQMYASLMRLAEQDASIQVFAAHEYTLANLAFAREIEPDNMALKSYQIHCKKKREKGDTTLPSNIGLERAINPFLRCDQATVRNAVLAYWQAAERQGKPIENIQPYMHAILSSSEANQSANVFALLREWKNLV